MHRLLELATTLTGMVVIAGPCLAAGAPRGDDLSIEDLFGIYQRAWSSTNAHTGVVQPWETRVVWTDAAGTNWNLQPDLENLRLLVGPDCPYYVEGGDVGFEFTITEGPDGPTVTSFEFRNRDYELVSTGSPLDFVLDGGIPTLSTHYLKAARTWFTARDLYESGAYADAMENLNALWDEYPIGDEVWWSIFGDEPLGLN
ncbi:MAG: hypothetical protein GY911_12330, partial [Actinomycetales bacterium]|nr:hypothetical protein [Actinomycetales bacterium]